MNESRIVTPEEAEGWVVTYASRRPLLPSEQTLQDLAHTVATEHERRDAYARAAVVRALGHLKDKFSAEGSYYAAAVVFGEADAIENGADYA